MMMQMPPSRSPGRLVVIAIVAAAALGVGLWSRTARADNVDTLIAQLRDGSDYKERLGAALNLAKLGDARAVPAMVGALSGDSDKNVRSAAAVGLGRLVTDRVKGSARNLAIAALKKASAGDDSEFVKAQADKALAAIGVEGGGESVVRAGGGGGGVYVNLGPMSSKSGTDDAKLRDLMRATAEKTLGRVAREMATTWPGGEPTKKQLADKKTTGFFVDGTLNELTTKEKGAATIVSCKINMLIASFPDKSMFGFLNGGATVQASNTPSDIALARQDCVSAVIEDLIAKKIVPTIKTKAAP
jgi:hypothetical protein